MTFPSPVSHASTLLELLHERATRHGQRRLFSFLEDAEGESSEFTYAGLWQRARALGAFPRQQQGAAGERAVLRYPPDPTRLERPLPRLRWVATAEPPQGVWIRR